MVCFLERFIITSQCHRVHSGPVTGEGHRSDAGRPKANVQTELFNPPPNDDDLRDSYNGYERGVRHQAQREPEKTSCAAVPALPTLSRQMLPLPVDTIDHPGVQESDEKASASNTTMISDAGANESNTKEKVDSNSVARASQ